MQSFLDLLVKVGIRMAVAVGVLFVSDLIFMVAYTLRKGESDKSEGETVVTTAWIRLLQLRVLCFRFLQDGDVGVGVFPDIEEILIRCPSLGGGASQRIRSPKLQTRQRT
jgi:hypothetical protein